MKFKKLGALILGALLTIGVAAGIGATVEKDRALAADEPTYSYTFTSSQFSANGTKELGGVSWTLSGDGGYWGYDGTKGQQFGSGSKPYKSLTLTSSNFDNVKTIKINTSGASSIKASFVTKVGNTQIGSSSTTLTTTDTEYTFEAASAISGEVSFVYTQTSSKAIYIKSISIDCGETTGEDVYPSEITITPKTAEVAQGDTLQLTASIDEEATINDVAWRSSDETATVSNVGLVTVADNAVVGTQVTITAYSENDSNVSDTAIITVVDAIPASTTLRRSGYIKYKVGQKITDCENSRLYIEYSNGEKDIEITDPKLDATVDGTSWDILNDVFTKEHNGKKLILTYTDGEYIATFAENSPITLQIYEELKINSLSTNFNTNSNFILSNIDNKVNSITVKYDCWENSSADVLVESSDKKGTILDVGEVKKEMNSSTGTLTISVTPIENAEGQVELTITLTYNELSDSTHIVIPVVKGVETQTEETTQTTEIDSRNQGYSNTEEVSTISSGDVTLTFDKGTNSNAPKYYDSGTAIRVYGGSTVTVSSSNTITNIKITFGSGEGSNQITTDCGTYSDGTWTGSASSVIFTVGGTSGNRRFQVFTITTQSSATTIIKESDDFIQVNTFVNGYMHHNDYATTDGGTGACLGDTGYYNTALTALSSLTNEQRLIFKNTFTLSYARLQAWAVANGDLTFEINNKGSISNAQGLRGVMIQNQESTLIIILVALVALTGFAFFYVSKRNKKEIEL